MNSNPKDANASWIKGLDSIRFILAFIVLLSHFDNPWADYFKHSGNTIQKGLSMLLPNLFLGVGAVIAFFIISGFVIHYPNKNKMPNVLKYLLRRWLRIGIPLFITALIALYYNCFYIIPIWSLYCELIYYTIYPLLIKIKISWKSKFIASFILSFVFICLFCKEDILSFIHQKNNNYSGAYWQLGPLLTWIVGLPCWLLGVLLAEKIDAISTVVSNKRILFLRVLVFVISVLFNMAKFHFFLSYILSMNVYALLLFVWLKDEIQYYKEKPPINILEKMGAFSYSLYLIHSLSYRMLNHFFELNRFSYFLFIIATILMAYLFYRLVEKPAHTIAKKIAASVKVKPISLTVSN